MKKLITSCLLMVSLLLTGGATAHETDTYKHGSIGPCFGWGITDVDTRICFLDEEKKMCSTMIYIHGIFHVTEPYLCEVEEEDHDE